MSTPRTKIHVPFADLRRQYETIKDEVDGAIQSVLNSAHFVGGEFVEKFEDEFAHYVGAEHAVAVGSGTAALELALKSTGIGPGDQVIVPANTFFATAEAVSNVGATPVFSDVNPRTFHLSLDSAERLVTGRTRAIIPVHLYGRAMDLVKVEEFAARHRLVIIEDAAQAHGAVYRGATVGGSGHLACFSFYPGKNLGAYGDGGAVTCNNADLARSIRLLREHGSPSKYVHSVVGTNSRLDAIQTAVLSVKLRHIDSWNSSRIRHANTYAEALKRTVIQPPEIPGNGEHNFHLFVVRTPKRDELRDFLANAGIETGIHYPQPVHLTEAYHRLGAAEPGSLMVTEALAQEILSLPIYPELSPGSVDYVIQCLLEFSGRLQDDDVQPVWPHELTSHS